MKNKEIAAMFETMADVMEIKGENPFRINSYRKVASVLGDLGEDIEDVADSRGIESLPGIGKSSAAKINEYLRTGKMTAHEELLSSFPAGALELLRIPDIGPKTIARLVEEKDITGIDGLEQAIDDGRLDGMQGIGPKTIEKMRKGLAFVKSYKGRVLLGDALPVAMDVISELENSAAVKTIAGAGSLRRRCETIGDVDILAAVDAQGAGAQQEDRTSGAELIGAFTNLSMADEVLAAGDTKASVRTRDGLQVDLRVVPSGSFGAALLYFTGSKEHNIKLRGIAAERGLKVNEYGVFRGEDLIGGVTETDLYAALQLPWIPPELREDRGEVEAAFKGRLPELVEMKDLKGELHAHTDYSDGEMTVEQMARAAADSGYEYLALTDHSKNLTVAGGLDEDALKERNDRIDRVNSSMDGIRVLKGTEVDILKDGSLDYPDRVLEGLDWVVASVHDHFGLSETRMTERILAAVRHPHVDCIGHLTGRLLKRREAYPVKLAAIIDGCLRSRTALELNAHPDRLDINDVMCREAKKAGVRIAIGADAHSAAHFRLVSYGISTARRGWIEAPDVLNTMSGPDLALYLGGG